MTESHFKNRHPFFVYGLPSSLLTILATIIVANLHQPERDIDYQFGSVAPVSDPQFSRIMENMLQPSIAHGNRITAYQNGDEFFPAMLTAIRQAKKTITLESYIYESGPVGEEFTRALVERARAGVKVHFLIDWIGSQKADQKLLSQLEDAGIEVRMFHPLAWYSLTRINNRTHRKILVVDGKIGFTGGVGIADKWSGHAENPEHWRDSEYRIVGPTVGQLQSAFMDNWLTTSPHVLHGEEYFPYIKPDGPSEAQVFKSSPSESGASARIMYLLSIAAARKSILLSSSYFVPDHRTLQAMLDARHRGVRIEVIVPGGYIDSQLVRKASRDTWGPLLEAGVRIFEFQPTMYHCKVLIVDETWVSVGSTNFDDRSFKLNSESNLNVLDPVFAHEQALTFARDQSRAIEVTLEAYRGRSLWQRMTDHVASWVSAQL
jgi:cardiolipin synthase